MGDPHTPTPGAASQSLAARLKGKANAFRALAPTYLANFIFQRIIGVNRDCRWSVHFTSKIQSPRNIQIHRTVRRSFAVSGGCYIQAENGLHISEGSIFAFGVKIITANHDPQDLRRHMPGPPVRIGRNCWLASNVVVLPGVELGDHTVVGAGSVVTKSFPEGHCVLVGIPARVLRRLDDPGPPSVAVVEQA